MTTLKMEIPKHSLIIPVGVPGSGKSTLLAGIEKDYDLPGFRYGADDVRERMFGDVSIQGAGDAIHNAARAMVKVRMKSGLPCSYDATNVTPTGRFPLLDMARLFEYFPIGLVSDVSLKESKRRNEEREIGRVPESVIEKMWIQVGSSKLNEVDYYRIYHFNAKTDRIEISWV